MQNFPKEILETIKQHLASEKARISSRIQELAAQDPFSNPDRVTDNAASDTEANEESTHDRFSAMADELKQQLADIQATLGRIENGTYGFCANCGDMIDTDRLAVLPTAKLCRSCEEKKQARS